MTFRALGFFFAVDQRLKLMVAFFTDVLVNGHKRSRPPLLESICGEFANLKIPRGEFPVQAKP
jgi:hypothetical protein